MTDIDFEELPKEIQNWLRSQDVARIIDRSNEKMGLIDDAAKAIPFCTTWIVTGIIAPEECVSTLIEDFGISPEKSYESAKTIKNDIFMPIRYAVRSKLGIDIDKLTASIPKPVPTQNPKPPAAPQARVTTLEKPFGGIAENMAPPGAAKAVTDIKKPVPPTPVPQARTMQLNQALTPEKQQEPETPKPAQKTQTEREADTVKLEKPFGFVEVTPAPPAPASAPAVPVAPAPTAPQPKPVNTPNPPPQKSNDYQELEAYEDHHPVAE